MALKDHPTLACFTEWARTFARCRAGAFKEALRHSKLAPGLLSDAPQLAAKAVREHLKKLESHPGYGLGSMLSSLPELVQRDRKRDYEEARERIIGETAQGMIAAAVKEKRRRRDEYDEVTRTKTLEAGNDLSWQHARERDKAAAKLCEDAEVYFATNAFGLDVKFEDDMRVSLAPVQQSPTAPTPAQNLSFKHSPDYRSAIWREIRFNFSKNAAAAISILHEAALNGTPEVSADYVLAKIESSAARLRDVFDGTEAWGCLVIPGNTKGAVRLNAP